MSFEKGHEFTHPNEGFLKRLNLENDFTKITTEKAVGGGKVTRGPK